MIRFLKSLFKQEDLIIPKTSLEHRLFIEKAMSIIGTSVETFGFVRHDIKIEEYFSKVTYRKGKLYIQIKGTTYPTDYPYSYNIVLGVGESENFNEWDWNSIALWRLINKMENKNDSKEYDFPFNDKIEISILNAKNELLKYADSFMKNDLKLFNEVLSEQNITREKYKLNLPDNKLNN